MKKMVFTILILFLLQTPTIAQSNDKRSGQLDIQHYSFNLHLNDETDLVKGEAVITISFLQDSREFNIDLAGIQANGKGMKVISVFQDSVVTKFEHKGDEVLIHTNALSGETKKITIKYEGIPADGLIISKNKYNQRTIFGDNWPNRAHNWLPCIDQPSDKASVEFMITAPEHYQVISNGLLVEQTTLPGNFKRTHWLETVPLPTKVMVIGLANFAVGYAGDVECIPVYSWVYSQDRQKGFYDYGQAVEILPWFIKNIGPYPFRKLANVQSKTRFGGMENAGAIFYFENSVTGNRTIEPLLAHEIAHQWFGNSVTEKNWLHLWLSEGFATYMTHMYMESKYGKETLVKRMKDDRSEVIKFSVKKKLTLVDSIPVKNYMEMLNVNAYQKGGWVLHMLRKELGDPLFMKGIQAYYVLYKGKNAVTEDFQRVMETVSGKDLRSFFLQWVYTRGQPDLKLDWNYDAAGKSVNITILQKQPEAFLFPLDVQVRTARGTVRETFQIKNKTTTVKIPIGTKPDKVILDPDTQLLFSVSE